MSSIKKSQHYVWKHYLKPWTTNSQINCLRDGKQFKTSLDNIAQQNYFYRSNPINKEEVEFVNKFIQELHPSAQDSLLNLLKVYLVTSSSSEYAMKCGIEDLHGIVEVKFIPLLESLYKFDLSFFEYTKEKNDFSFFIGCQYSRTNNMRSLLSLSNLKFPDNVNIENIAKIFSLFIADLIGNWVFSKAKIQLVKNVSTEYFITGDQPVFNLKGTGNVNTAPMEFELFYPISPTQAIILKESNIKPIIEIDDPKEIWGWNSLIRQNAKEQIYSLIGISLL